MGPQDSMSRRKQECAKERAGWRGRHQPVLSLPLLKPGRQTIGGGLRLTLNFYGTRRPPAGTSRGPEVRSLTVLDIELARADRGWDVGMRLGPGLGAQVLDPAPPAGFPGDSQARTPGWPERGRTSHAASRWPGCGRCGGPALSSEHRIPNPKTGWRPAAVALTSADRAKLC